jgi:hypothetical protein
MEFLPSSGQIVMTVLKLRSRLVTLYIPSLCPYQLVFCYLDWLRFYPYTALGILGTQQVITKRTACSN